MESNTNKINNDHIYHKNIRSPTSPVSLLETSSSYDIVEAPTFQCSPAKPSEFELQLESNSDFSMLDDIGSDGNKSPYSDISSVQSPEGAQDLFLDWNDSFIDLFPQLE